MNLSLNRIFSKAMSMNSTVHFISGVCSGMVKGVVMSVASESSIRIS